MVNNYASVTQFGEFTNSLSTTLDRDSNTFLEELGQGTNSPSMFVLRKKGSLTSSVIIYYGSSEQDAIINNQTLTLDTHYTINQQGIISINATGATLVGVNLVYADYSYFIEGYEESMVQRVLDVSARHVEDYCENSWRDGSVATPNYGVTLNLNLTGRGLNNRYYFLPERPLPDVSTTLDGSVSSGATTLTVVSTDNFPSSGVLEVDGLKLEYTGKTATTFTGVTGVIRDIATSLTIVPYCFEASNTPDGFEPQWSVLKQNSDYYFDKATGRVYLSKTTPYAGTDLYYDLAPPKGVPNRFRASFIYGASTVPEPITQATIMIAQRLLTSSTIANATMKGVDGFSPRANDVLNQDIKMLLKDYKQLKGFTSS